MDRFEKLLCDTLTARGRSERTQETYALMLRIFARSEDDVQRLVDEQQVSFANAFQTPVRRLIL